MNKYRVFFLFIFQSSFAEIDVLNLKNSFVCVENSDNRMLSPLVGALSWHSDWMKNFYRFGDPQTACVKLVHDIFYYNTQIGHFAITKSISSLAAFLNQHSAIDLLVKWYLDNRQNLIELAQYKNELAQNKKGFSKKGFNELRNSWFAKSKAEFSQGVKERVGEDSPNYKLLTQIENAFYELSAEKVPYPSFVLDQILATYWFIAQRNDDKLSEYVKRLLGEACTDSVPAKYSRKELKSIKNYSGEEIFNLLKTDSEKLAIFLLETLGKGKNPPYVNQGQYVYNDYENIPDCVESTLRNFFNFILFDGNQYNFDLLPEVIKKNINSKLREFYHQFQLEETLSYEAGQSWFDLIASLHSIDGSIAYNKEICEAYGASQNVIKILNVLLGTQAKVFTDFGTMLSTSLRSLYIDATDVEGEYFMSFPQEEREAKLIFSREHASCSFDPQRGDLNRFFDIIAQNSTDLNLVMLTLSLPIYFTADFFYDRSYLYLGCDLENPNILVNVVQGIIKVISHEKREQSSYCAWLNELILNLKSKDWFLYRKALGALAAAYDFIPSCAQNILESSELPQELLFIGAEFGATSGFLNKMLDKGASLDKRDETGDTPFMLAAARGQLDALRMFFDLGVNLEEKNFYGETALMLAADLGHIDVAEYLVEKKANLDAQDSDGFSIFMWVVKRGQIEMAKKLLEWGVAINEKGPEEKSPLMVAVETSYANMVKFLIEAGADINEKNDEGQTALMIARLLGNEEIIKLLMEAQRTKNAEKKLNK